MSTESHLSRRFLFRPRGPLSRATGLRDDVSEVVGPRRPADVAKRGTQLVG